ncbi:MAG TPA: nuclear transport factor 2 family protein [Trebonia sp.]
MSTSEVPPASDSSADLAAQLWETEQVKQLKYLELVPRQLADAFTTHHGHMPEITLLGPTEATGVWAMFDYVLYPGRPTGIKGYGHYHETYRKGDDGKWRISSKRNQRLRLDEIPNPS